MKSAAIIDVVAITVEVTVPEAVAICQGDEQANDRLLSHIRGQLKGAAHIDPENGEQIDGQLTVRRSTPALLDGDATATAAADNAKQATERKGGSESKPFHRRDGTHGSQEAKRFKCPECGKALKSEHGVKIHLANWCEAKWNGNPPGRSKRKAKKLQEAVEATEAQAEQRAQASTTDATDDEPALGPPKAGETSKEKAERLAKWWDETKEKYGDPEAKPEASA